MSRLKMKCPTPNSRGDRAFTLLELIVAMVLLLLLASAALPLARNQVKRAKEEELRRHLREMREAIDRYKDYADRGMIPANPATFNYPPDLKTLVEGVVLRGTAKGKYKFLRQIPVDPMTANNTSWKLVMEDAVQSVDQTQPGIYDVHSGSDKISLEGTPYSEW